MDDIKKLKEIAESVQNEDEKLFLLEMAEQVIHLREAVTQVWKIKEEKIKLSIKEMEEETEAKTYAAFMDANNLLCMQKNGEDDEFAGRMIEELKKERLKRNCLNWNPENKLTDYITYLIKIIEKARHRND